MKDEKLMLLTPEEENHELGCKTFRLKRYMKEKRYQYERKVNSVRYFEIDHTMSCTCGLFEGAGWPCVHMFAVMKYCNLSEIPLKMLNSRWSKHVIPGGQRMNSNISISITQMREIRFGSLHGKCLQLCNIVSGSKKLYKEAMSNVIHLTNRMLQLSKHKEEPMTHKRHRSNINIIKDPIVARTKGSQSEASRKNKGKRLCGICEKPSHKRTTYKEQKTSLSNQKEEVSTCHDSARADSSEPEDLFEAGLYKAITDVEDFFVRLFSQ